MLALCKCTPPCYNRTVRTSWPHRIICNAELWHRKALGRQVHNYYRMTQTACQLSSSLRVQQGLAGRGSRRDAQQHASDGAGDGRNKGDWAGQAADRRFDHDCEAPRQRTHLNNGPGANSANDQGGNIGKPIRL